MTEPDQSKPEAKHRADVIGRIVARLTNDAFGTGPLAELRRLNPEGRLSEPALHRLLARHVPDGWLVGAGGIRGWALIIHCLALAAPDNLRGNVGLGAALQLAGFGESRLVKLLDADADELHIRLPRAVRFLVHRGGRLHGPQLSDLVLTPLASDFYDVLRQRIASEYYRAEHRATKADDPAAA